MCWIFTKNYMKISIIIPTYNHLDDCLRPCLESIIKYSNLADMEIIVVANGCTDKTKEHIHDLQKIYGNTIQLIWFDDPIGYTAACNNGIRSSRGEVVILLNNDTVLLPQNVNTWLNMLLDPLKDASVGISGPMEAYSPEAQEKFLIFFCVAVKRNLFDEIGFLDEVFSPGFGEDTDFCIKAKRAGYSLVQVPDYDIKFDKLNDKQMIGGFPIYHAGEKTFGEIDSGHDLLTKNRITLIRRYAKSIKLNLGSGDIDIDGYISVDLKNKRSQLRLDARELTCFEDNTVDEISAIHLFEHFSPYDAINILKEWLRVLKPGGKLNLEMPDTLEMCRNFEKSDKKERYVLLNCFYGTTFPEFPHLFGWYDEILTDLLLAAGFTKIERKEIQFKNHWGHNMRFESVKADPIKKNKVYDCVPFFNELELLELRLIELNDVVDYFVIVEATKTYSGKPKSLSFNENKERFAQWQDKIRHIVVDNMPDGDDPWAREHFQRNEIMRGLTDAQDTDVIIISDVDEIPNSKAIKAYSIDMGIKCLQMTLHYYYLNCTSDILWNQAKILPFSLLRSILPNGARHSTCLPYPNGGWHFSFTGGIDRIVQKIDAYSHQEYNTDAVKSEQNIANAMENAKDIFGRNLNWSFVQIDKAYPKYVFENQNKFVDIGFIKPI